MPNLMCPFQGDEPEQGASLDVQIKNSAFLHATGVDSKQSAAGIVLQVELANRMAYLKQSAYIRPSST